MLGAVTMRMRLAFVLLLTFPCQTLAAPKLSGNGFVLEYREAGGARLTVGGVPIMRASSIQLHAPDWKQGYYSSNDSPREVETSDDGRTITVRHASDKHVKFHVTERYQLLGEHKLAVRLTGQLETDVPAQLEWAIGYVNAFALYGGAYSAPGAGARVEPQAPTTAEQPEVVKSSDWIKLESAAGSIECVADRRGPKLTLLDGRLAPQRWWAMESPTLWLGCIGVPVKVGEPFELSAVLTIQPAPPARFADAVTQPLELRRVPRAYDPPQRPFYVIPTPRQITLHPDQRIALPAEALISTQAKAVQAGALLSRQLNQRFGLNTRASDVSEMFKDDDSEIELSLGSADQIKPEGYTIRCSSDGIDIRAIDAAGFRYAVQTLLQFARPMPDGAGGAYVPACEIADEPSLAFRGVHLFPGKDVLDLHRCLIENVIARYKFNHVVLECEYTQWDSARGIWVDISVPKEQIKAYVKMLRENGLEPIPLVQSLGHCGWMFKNGQNLDLAEDPDTPVAYDATNAKTYEFIDRIYEEALELFGPVRFFHIGHDEVTLFGKYPNRETSKQWGTTKLFLHDIEHWREFFEPRGIKLMMWGDMLLAREEIKDGAAFSGSLEEARVRRAELAKDITICDWHYDGLKPDEYPSLTIFKDAGFARTIASTWYNPRNIYGFAEAARRAGAFGLLQTTWAGYNLDEGALDRELKQFGAYVLAAEYAWSATSPPPDGLPWRADEVIVRALAPPGQSASPQPGFITTLPGTAARHDAFRAVERVDGYTFHLGQRQAQLGGALTSNETLLPQRVTMKLAVPARQLAFLHATSFPAERGEVVGRYEIRFADGATVQIPLKSGLNIRALDDIGIAREAIGSLAKKDDGGGLTVTARVFVWTNPHPDKPIESVTFATDHPCASPVLFALTGIGGAAR